LKVVKERKMDARGPWYVVGPLIGLTVVVMLWVTNRPLGALGGYIDLHDWIRRPSGKAGWRLFFLVGVIGGGLLQSLLSGGVHPTLGYGGFAGSFGSPAVEATILIGAGLLMGFGARTATGCTSGHGITGAALGSSASYVATMTFMATAVLAAPVLARVIGGGR
jgi:uncharacterized membrane protein YedE/YeeE